MDIQEYIESGIIESYVLGLADAEETLEVERLRETSPEVRKAIDEFALAVENQAFANAIAPPADVKQQLWAELKFGAETDDKKVVPLAVSYRNTDDQQPKTDSTQAAPSAGQWKTYAAAAVVLFVVSCIGNVVLYNKFKTTNDQYLSLLTERNTLQANNQMYQTRLNEYRTAAQMMADPTVSMVLMKDPAKLKDNMTTVFWDSKTKDVYLMANKLPTPGNDKQYQLWALVDGKPVDAGMLDPECTTLCKMKNMPKAQAFAITLEKRGGSPLPTMDQLYVLGNI